MVQRRTLIKAGLVLPFSHLLLTGCSREDERPMTRFYEEGMYLKDNFAPLDVEMTSTDLEVIGNIPAELVGRYVRNGPNPLGNVDPDSHHWFIGNGMVHGVRLEDGRADWFRSRFVRSEKAIKYLGEDAAGRDLTFGANTHVIGHGGRTWALVESGVAPVELDYEFETLGHDSGWGGYAAHPKLDPDTGELHAISYDWARLRDHIQYVVVDENARERKRVDIPMQGMSMIHDMSLTKNYVVIYDFPVTVSLLSLATGAEFPFRWDEDHEPRVGLMRRDSDGSDVTWCPVQPQYAFHPMNAFEDEDGNVVIDIVCYDRIFERDLLGPFGDTEPHLARWHVNPGLRRVSENVVDERPQEFPRCHPARNSKSYRYGYTLEVGEKSFPGIIKYDMQTGRSSAHRFAPGHHGAEPLFVPAENGRNEDDGYLMTFVYSKGNNRSAVHILDARDLSRPPLAQIRLPTRVPYGFHGSWIPDPPA